MTVSPHFFSPTALKGYAWLSALGRKFGDVAQVSNLPYRRFPIGRRGMARHAEKVGVRRLEALRYSRLETCATIRHRIYAQGHLALFSLIPIKNRKRIQIFPLAA